MSLINDALKRAKQAKKDQLPATSEAPPLRPAEPSYRPSLWPFFGLPLALAVVLALAGIFLWRWIDQTKRQPTQRATKSSVEPNPPPGGKMAIPNPKLSGAQTSQASLPTQAVPSTTMVATSPAVTNLTPTSATNETSNTTVAATQPSAPPPLKLQGIFYTRKNPSAVINGKIRHVGDRIGDAKLVAIAPESVTVEVAGKTNELVLP